MEERPRLVTAGTGANGLNSTMFENISISTNTLVVLSNIYDVIHCTLNVRHLGLVISVCKSIITSQLPFTLFHKQE